MTYAEIEYRVDGAVATIALNRPERLNAVTPLMVSELLAAIDEADGDDAVRVLVLTGNGRGFCAGADLAAGSDVFDYDRNPIDLPGSAAPAGDVPRDGAGLITLRLFDCVKPVVAAVNGAAVGMGATMILAADLRLASEAARFGFVFARRGIAPEGASTWFLPRIVGVSRAADWLYTGRIFDAQEAFRSGLVQSVHPAGDLLDVAHELASEISASAPLSVGVTRQLLWRMLGASHPMEAHRADSRAVYALGATPDAREGVASFLEKRPAQFGGRVSVELPDVFPDWQDPRF